MVKQNISVEVTVNDVEFRKGPSTISLSLDPETKIVDLGGRVRSEFGESTVSR
jgi:hypothetical protein